VETKRSVGSTVNAILTRQTCGRRTSRAADRKRRVIKIHSIFSKRICHMFLILNCRGDWDLGLFTFCLAKENRGAMATSKKKFSFARWKNQNLAFCNSFFPARTLKVHRPDLSLLYILTFGTYSKFARETSLLALGVCFPQPSSSTGRRFAASRSRLQNYQRIVSFPQKVIDGMRCNLARDSTENPCSIEKYPTPT